MRKFLTILALVIAGAVLLPVGVGAANLNPICNDGDLTDEQREAAGCDLKGDELINKEGKGKVPDIVNAVLWIAGLLAVGMIIYAAVRMVISQGDSAKMEQEKKTIMYAVTGLIVTLLAYVIVGFIAGQFSVGGGGDDTSTPGTSDTEGENK